MNIRASSNGFTLIEMSIVMMVIGLIVGGILVGQELIAQARLRAAASEINQIKSAITTFETVYNCIPGDCINGYQFFGSANCVNNTTNAGNGCNGNGDGNVSSAGWWTERTKFWGHLSMAGYLKGSYDLSTAGGLNELTNLPPSSLSPGQSKFEIYNGPTGGVLKIATGNYIMPNNSAATPYQASMIDQKIDDGVRTTGNITASWGGDMPNGYYCGGGGSGVVAGAGGYAVSPNDINSMECIISILNAW